MAYQEKHDNFRLYYLGRIGNQAHFSDGAKDIFLPHDRITYRMPAPEKALDKIQVTIPLWLARKQGLL